MTNFRVFTHLFLFVFRADPPMNYFKKLLDCRKLMLYCYRNMDKPRQSKIYLFLRP